MNKNEFRTCMHKFRMTSLTNEEEYRKLADAFIEYAEKEESPTILNFICNHGYNEENFAGFCNHSDYFSKAYDKACEIMTAKMKALVKGGKANPRGAKIMIEMLSPEFRRRSKRLRLEKQKALLS